MFVKALSLSMLFAACLSAAPTATAASAKASVMPAYRTEGNLNGYTSTCHDIHFQNVAGDGVYINAVCNTGQGSSTRNTHFKLGGCLGNRNGQLVAQTNGAFGRTCQDIGQPDEKDAPGIISATCRTNIGTFDQTSYQTNNIIANLGGYLHC